MPAARAHQLGMIDLIEPSAADVIAMARELAGKYGRQLSAGDGADKTRNLGLDRG